MDDKLTQFINMAIDRKLNSMSNMANSNHAHNGYDVNQLDPATALLGFPVIQIPNGNILTVSINTAGSGYVVGNVLILTGGNNNASVLVTSIGGGGTVTGISLINGGTGYSVAAGLNTTTPSAGTGAKINVLTLTVATTPPTDKPNNGIFRFYVDTTPTYVFWAYLNYQNASGALIGAWKSVALT